MNEKDNFQNNELLAYIGMEINALLAQGYSSSQTKHLVSAQLVECIMKTVAVKEKDEYDLYALKPLLVAVKYIVDREIAKEQEEEFAALPQIQKDIRELKQISGYLDKKINLIEPSNMNVEGTITIKEEYSSVKLLRQINNDIYGFATERNLYLIDMKHFQVMTIIELDIPEDAKYIDVITRNEYYELRYTINGYDWMSLTNITFNGEYYQI